MTKQRKGLGSLGVDVLLSSTDTVVMSAADDSPYQQIPIDLIQRSPFQPRQTIDDTKLEELAQSVRTQGLMQPVVVRKRGDQFELIAGERRWRAAQKAGLHNIPAIVREVSDQNAAALALIENLQREDLNPIEEAHAFKRLAEEFSLTHEEIGETVGRSRAAVTNTIRLLDLASEVKNEVLAGRLEMGHARALLTLSTTQQIAAAQDIVKRSLSVRAAEALVKHLLKAGETIPVLRHQVDPDIKRLEQELQDRLGAPVRFKHHPSGKGQLTIHYHSLDELDGILHKIK